MSVEESEESLYLGDPIEEPVIIIRGEGSGAENFVGNEEKKKIFFFGQPGCLKHSPIKAENHNNHNNASDGAGANTKEAIPELNIMQDEASERVVPDDDEDGQELLQKISEVLEDEPNCASNIVKSTSANASLSQLPPLKETPESIEKVNPNHNKASSHNAINQSSEKSRVNNVDKLEEKQITTSKQKLTEKVEMSAKSEKSSEIVNSKAANEGGVPKKNPLFSIVPYDDDSMSSSSQVEIEPASEENTEVVVKIDEVVKPEVAVTPVTPETKINTPAAAKDETSASDSLESTEVAMPEKVEEHQGSLVGDDTKDEVKPIEIPEKSDLNPTSFQPDAVTKKETENCIEEIAIEPCEDIAKKPSEEIATESCEEIEREIKPSEKIAKEPSEKVAKEPSEEIVTEPSELPKQAEEVLEPESSAAEAASAVEDSSSIEVSQKEETVEDESPEVHGAKVEDLKVVEEVESVEEVTEVKGDSEQLDKTSSAVESVTNQEVSSDLASVTDEDVEATVEPVAVSATTEEIKIETPMAKPSIEEVVSEISESPSKLEEELIVDSHEELPPTPPVEEAASRQITVEKEICEQQQEELVKEKEIKSEDEIEQEEAPCVDKMKLNDEVEKIEVNEQFEDKIESPIEPDVEDLREEVTSEEKVAEKEIVEVESKETPVEVNEIVPVATPQIKSPEPVTDECAIEMTESFIASDDEPIKEMQTSDTSFQGEIMKKENELEVHDNELPSENDDKESATENESEPEVEVVSKPQEPEQVELTVEPAEVSESTPMSVESETLEDEKEEEPEVDLVQQPELTPIQDREPTPIQEPEVTPVHEPEATPIQETESTSIQGPEIIQDQEPEPTSVQESEPSQIVEPEIEPVALVCKASLIDTKESAESPEENVEEEPESDEDQNEFPGDDLAGADSDLSDISEDDQPSPPPATTEKVEIPAAVIEVAKPTISCFDEMKNVPVKEAPIESLDLTNNKTKSPPKVEVHKVENNVKERKTKIVEETKVEQDPLSLSKPPTTRKRKISERKSVSESDSEGNNVTETVSHGNSSEDEEVVLKKKPRMRGKTTIARKALPPRAAKKQEEKKEEVLPEPKKEEEPTLQNLQFDFDGSEDIAGNVAAIKKMISKDSGVKKESESENSDDGSEKKAGNKRSRRARDRFSKRNEADSSSDDDSVKQSSKSDSKRSKTQVETKESPGKKKRESGTKGLLKYIDTSLVIDTTENEAPVRMSRRIAQQKIREETERRQVEEKMLKQMKAEAEKKKGKEGDEASDEDDDDGGEEYQKDSSGEDESFKEESPRKKKSKINAADKQWQTSSSHSEHSESEDYMEHVPSDPGSPLFKSDHEFSPESDNEETPVQPLVRARTAKKTKAVSSSDEDEDINPKHACQVCHKTDSPEWILLCDECDCGYHCSCLKPIIFLIPSGNWYCPLCCHKKLVGNLSEQLTQLDTLIHNIETLELRKQRQKQMEINEQNIIQERRKNRAESKGVASKASSPSKSSSGSSSDGDSDDAPLKDYFYKLRKRNQAAAPSYRFNEYDDLINSAIKRDMEHDNKGAGNLGRGKDISTIIEADNEEKKKLEDDGEGEEAAEVEGEADDVEKPVKEDAAGESSGSDVIRRKKTSSKKKKKKLNQLDGSSEEERVSDEDFKGTSSSDSEVDEEDLSMSSVSESSLELSSKKKGRNVRTSTRTREKRVDRRFINDNDSDSDDEPLVRPKRARKKADSDEEEFDMNDDDDEEGSLAEEIDSEDLCDDTDTDESSDNNWPKKKKKRVASYDVKPRKAVKKKDDNEDKAFRAGISKKKVLKKSDNESEASDSGNEKGKRKTRGKKLLYLIEDDLDSDESDGIRPGVKRPETPPEEREMFFKKQEEIKRMLAAKDTEAAKKLAAPTIEPIHIAMERPHTPSPLPFSNEPASLSTIPKNVIESAKALDTDYNRIKPILGGQSRGNLQSNDMNEEELARMMEEEDFAQHQLKLAGEAIARKKLLDLEAKGEEFAAFTKASREKEWQPAPVTVEAKKRSRKSKSSEKSSEEFPSFSKGPPHMPQMMPSILGAPPMPPLVSSNMPQMMHKQMPMQPQPSIIANLMQQQPPQPFVPMPPSLQSERPSVLSSYMARTDLLPPHMKMHQPIPPDVFRDLKSQVLPPQLYDESDDKKKGRRKKFTPARTDEVVGNISKVPKLDSPSVIQTTMNPSVDRLDDKNKVPRPDHPKLTVAAPPQIFNPATNPTPSVITRLLQPQPGQRPGPGGPYGQGFTEINPAENPNVRMYPTPEEMKNASPGKIRSAMQPGPLGNPLPQGPFPDHSFVPRTIQHLYRGPPAYGLPHARLPPYPFHHLHPNLRPAAPYNIPPQFGYFAPPAHSRQPPQSSAIPLSHGPHVAGPEDISNSIRNANNSEEPSETSEFGGLVSYFSSQQELD